VLAREADSRSEARTEPDSELVMKMIAGDF
jgi:hypothetical protein